MLNVYQEKRIITVEKYSCPHCHQITYTADCETAQTCPYCSIEKVLVLNQKIFNSINEFTNTKIILDRRSTDRGIDLERRGKDAIRRIPVAWLVIKQSPPEKIC